MWQPSHKQVKAFLRLVHAREALGSPSVCRFGSTKGQQLTLLQPTTNYSIHSQRSREGISPQLSPVSEFLRYLTFFLWLFAMI